MKRKIYCDLQFGEIWDVIEAMFLFEAGDSKTVQIESKAEQY